jgi:hypothetical protein
MLSISAQFLPLGIALFDDFDRERPFFAHMLMQFIYCTFLAGLYFCGAADSDSPCLFPCLLPNAHALDIKLLRELYGTCSSNDEGLSAYALRDSERTPD